MSIEIKRAWIDCAGKCRTWFMFVDGEKIAEFKTLKGARKVKALLLGEGK